MIDEYILTLVVLTMPANYISNSMLCAVCIYTSALYWYNQFEAILQGLWTSRIFNIVTLLVPWASMGWGGGDTSPRHKFSKGGIISNLPPPPRIWGCMIVHWNVSSPALWPLCLENRPQNVEVGKKVSESPPPPSPHGLVRIDAHESFPQRISRSHDLEIYVVPSTYMYKSTKRLMFVRLGNRSRSLYL